MLIGVHAKHLLDAADVLGAVSRAVSLGLAGDGAADADDGADVDKGRLAGGGSLGAEQSGNEALDVVATVLDVDDVPAAGAHLGVDVLGVDEVDAAVAGDLVVVVDDDEVAQPPVAGELDGLHGHALLEAGVANHAPDGAADDVEAGPVVGGGEVLARHGQADGIGDTLAKRARCHLDALVLNLRVARAEGVGARRVVALELVQRHVAVARQVEERVLEEARVAVGEDEAVAVEVVWVAGRVRHDVLPQRNAYSCHAHCAPGN